MRSSDDSSCMDDIPLDIPASREPDGEKKGGEDSSLRPILRGAATTAALGGAAMIGGGHRGSASPVIVSVQPLDERRGEETLTVEVERQDSPEEEEEEFLLEAEIMTEPQEGGDEEASLVRILGEDHGQTVESEEGTEAYLSEVDAAQPQCLDGDDPIQ